MKTSANVVSRRSSTRLFLPAAAFAWALTCTAPSLSLAADYALAFSNATQVVNTSAKVTTADFTFEAWVKVSAYTTENHIFAQYVPGHSGRMIGFLQNTKMCFFIGGNYYVGNAVIPLNTWTHIAVTRSGNAGSIYLNGVLDKATTVITAALPTTYGITIGGDSNLNSGFRGQIADVRAWGAVRTQPQIAAFMNTRLTGTESGLVAYWPVNDGAGTSVNELVAHADGTLVGTPKPAWTYCDDLSFVNSITVGWWNASAGGNWSDAAKWLDGSVPNGDAHWALFTNQTAAALAVTNDLSPLLLGKITFSNPAGCALTGAAITFTNSALQSTMTVADGTNTFDAPAVLEANGLSVSSFTPAAITFGGVLSGSGTLVVNSAASGGGRVTLSGASTYTGPTTLGCGTLAIDALANGGAPSSIGASAASAGNLLLGPGTLHYTGPSTATDRGFTLQAGSGRAAILRTDHDLTLAGPVAASSGAFIKTGDGTLSLTYPGVNTLSLYEPTDLNALQNTGANGDSPTTGFSGLSVIRGRLELGVPGQTNLCYQRIDVGMRTTTNASAETTGELVLNDGALLANSTLSVGRSNGSTVTAPGGLSPKLIINGGYATCNLLALGYWGSIGAGYNCRPLCEINAGTLAINACNIGESTGCYAVVSVRGGTFSSAGGINIGGTQYPAGTGVLSVSGTGVVDVATDISLAASTFGYGTLNLNGGSLIARNIVKGGGLSGILTFNGGRYQPRTEGRTLSGLTAAYVSTNGAVVDTTLANYAITQNLLHAPDAPSTDGGFLKVGDHTLTFTSYGSTYTGPTVVSNGTLRIVGALPADNALAVAADGEALIGGSATQTVAAATLALDGTLGFAFAVDGSGNDRLTVASSPVIGAGSGISLYQSNTLLPFTKNGTYTLLTYSGADPAAANLSCDNPAYGKTYTFAASGGDLTVTIGNDTSTASVWDVNGSGDWDTGSNWSVPPVSEAGSQVRFDSAITAPATVTSAGATVGEIFLNNLNAYTLAGSGLTLDNTASPALINVESGAHRITAPLTLSGDTTLNLSASTLLTIGAAAGASATLTAQGNGTLALAAAPSVQALTVNVPEIGVSNTLTLTPPVALQRSIILRPALSTTTTVSGVISGTANLTKAGSSTLSLAAANTYSGVTTVSAGTLTADTLANGGTASSIGASPSTSGNWILGPATFHYTGPASVINRGYTLNAGSGRAAILKVDDELTLGGQCVSWSGAIVKTGEGTLRYTFANGAQTFATYEGNADALLNTGANGDGPTTGFSGYTISNGKVVMGAPGQTNTINYRITVGHYTTTAAGAETAGELEIVDGILYCNTTFSVGRGNGNATTAPGGISSRFTMNGGTANFNLIGVGYAGAAGSTFNARPILDINAGTVNVASDTRLGDSKGSIATLNVRGGTFRCSGQYGYAGLSIGGAQTSSGTGILNLMGTGVVDIAHNVLLGYSSGATGVLHLAGGSLVASNIVRGAGIGYVRFNGGTFFPRAPNRTMTGLTSASVSTNGAVFDTSLADGYTVAQNLLHDSDLGTGDGGLAKLGSNTLSLTGTANTFNGPVTVAGGLLRARLGGTNDLAVAPGAAFDALGARCTVGDLSGQGLLTNGVIAVSGRLNPGTNAAPAGATLTVENLSLLGGSTVACDWATNALGQVTNDFVAVTGALAPEGAGFFDLGRTEEDPIRMPFSMRVMSYGSVGGTFAGWKAIHTGLPAGQAYATVTSVADGFVTLEVRYSGTLLLLQ